MKREAQSLQVEMFINHKVQLKDIDSHQDNKETEIHEQPIEIDKLIEKSIKRTKEMRENQ